MWKSLHIYISLHLSALPTYIHDFPKFKQKLNNVFWDFTITGNILALKLLTSVGFRNRALAAVSRISLKPRAQTSFCPPHGFQLQRFRFRGKSDFLRWRLAVFYLPRPWISVFLWTFSASFLSPLSWLSALSSSLPCPSASRMSRNKHHHHCHHHHCHHHHVDEHRAEVNLTDIRLCPNIGQSRSGGTAMLLMGKMMMMINALNDFHHCLFQWYLRKVVVIMMMMMIILRGHEERSWHCVNIS